MRWPMSRVLVYSNGQEGVLSLHPVICLGSSCTELGFTLFAPPVYQHPTKQLVHSRDVVEMCEWN